MISAARCSSEDYLHRMPLKIEESLIGRVVRERQPIMIPNVLEEKQYRYPELARKTGLSSLLSVPMFTRDTVIGTINIYTREPHQFAEDEVDFVKVVAGQAAIAIENARLMSETLEAKRALETRKVVERAKGIMQHKYHITEEDAYLKLRNESRRLRRPMRDLAEAIILADELEKQRTVEARRSKQFSFCSDSSSHPVRASPGPGFFCRQIRPAGPCLTSHSKEGPPLSERPYCCRDCAV